MKHQSLLPPNIVTPRLGIRGRDLYPIYPSNRSIFDDPNALPQSVRPQPCYTMDSQTLAGSTLPNRIRKTSH
jgi:hypothetical protein